MAERRDVLQGLLALAGAQWAEEGIDPTNVEEWGALERSTYLVDEFDVERAAATLHGPAFRGVIRREDVTDCALRVDYTPEHVLLSVEAAGDADVEASAAADVAPTTAKELGAALYRAGRELEAWREADDG